MTDSTIPEEFINKPERSFEQSVRTPDEGVMLSVYGGGYLDTVWGSDSNANFLDVLSVGPISSVKKIFVNEVDLEAGEFPKSSFFPHTGSGSETPWAGGYPFVERTYQLGKAADVIQEEKFTETSFIRQVSSKGVEAIRVNFTTGGFTQRDTKNRVKTALAYFKVSFVDEFGNITATVDTTKSMRYFATNPTSVQLTLEVPSSDIKNTLWSYKVSMHVVGENYSTPASGSWSASTVTEIYRDTQTYENVAFCSGSIVASEVEAKTPKRQYLVSGYKVQVPKFQTINGKEVFTGGFDTETSDSYAWNAMAVLTDTLWGAGLPIDKINILSFLEFDRYCATLIDGIKRYSHSQYLIKSENYFKLAAQIVGNADGKLYEDTTGRIGILVDKQTDNRRVITSFDLQDEKVKRTTVPESKKTNQVIAEFDDKTNNYKTTIIQEDDQAAIDKNGLLSKKLQLDTCTDPVEAQRMIKKYLATSQVTTTSYVINVGATHEDIQIGDVIELYDRIHSRVNYCGKVAEGTTSTIIKIDKRTPIDLSAFEGDMYLKLDNSRGIPTKSKVKSWTSLSITLESPLESVPEAFVSFGVEGSLSPVLIRVISTTDNKNSIQVEGVAYNDSLYSYVEQGTPLIVPVTRYLPPKANEDGITGLAVARTETALRASWDSIVGWNYQYFWKRKADTDKSGGITISSGTIKDSSQPISLLNLPLDPTLYTFHVRAYDPDNLTDSTELATKDYLLTIDAEGTSPISGVDVVGLEQEDGTIGTTFKGRDFVVKWEQDEPEEVSIQGFGLRISQGSSTLERTLTSDVRSYRVSEKDLMEVFGSDMDRGLTINIVTIDSNLLTSVAVTRTISNPAVEAPIITVASDGDVHLETFSGLVPDDAVKSKAYIWKEGTEESLATVVETLDLSNINVPDGVIEYDGSTYNYKATWVDGFGEKGTNYGYQTFVANPDLLVPVAPELTEVIPLDETTVYIKFEHDGTWLHNLRFSFRQVGFDIPWTIQANIFTFPPEVGELTHGFDLDTGIGFVKISGLALNTEYEFKTKAANLASAWSEDSNIVKGYPYLSADTSVIENEIDAVLGGLDVRELIAEGVVTAFADLDLNKAIVKEEINRKDEDSQIVAEIRKLTSETTSQRGKALAEYTSFISLMTDTEKSVITQLESLETSFTSDIAKTNAGVSNVLRLVTDETSSRIAQVNKLTTSFEDEVSERESSIENLQLVVANNKQAAASDITKLTARVGDEEDAREAAIVEVREVITSESQARALAINQLNTSLGNDISAVFEKATAAIGYCLIGGSTSSHSTKESCESVGGTWVLAPFSEAVKQVQITSGGSTVTVGGIYSTVKGIESDLSGKATIGVTASGVFTGVEFFGSSTGVSSITFSANSFKLKDTAGSTALEWNDSIDSWNFSGSIQAKQGRILESMYIGQSGTGIGFSGYVSSDDDLRIWAGNTNRYAAPYRVYESGKMYASNVDITGHIHATSGQFDGTVYANKIVGEIASGTLLPYTGFVNNHGEDSFSQTYTLMRFKVEPVKGLNGVVIPSIISTNQMGSVDWVVSGAGYDKQNEYQRIITAVLKNTATGESYTKVIHNARFNGQSGFTDLISVAIPSLSLSVHSSTSIYEVTLKVQWIYERGTRDGYKVSLESGNTVVTRVINSSTITQEAGTT